MKTEEPRRGQAAVTAEGGATHRAQTLERGWQHAQVGARGREVEALKRRQSGSGKPAQAVWESPHKRCGLRCDRTENKTSCRYALDAPPAAAGRARVKRRGAIVRRRRRDRTDAAAHGRKESSRAVRLLVRMRVAASTRARAHTPFRTPHCRPRSTGTLIGSPSLAPERVAVTWLCTSATRNARHAAWQEPRALRDRAQTRGT